MQQLQREREREREVMATNVNDEEYDRMKEVKQFDESKIGVKGLVDSGITAIPRFFVHPPDVLSQFKPGSKTRPDLVIPTIDLSGVDSHHNRSLIVDQIRQACSSFGFFQIINRGVPMGVLDRTIESIKGFHEEPTEIKARFYTRELGTDVSYISNVDLYNSKAASWRYV